MYNNEKVNIDSIYYCEPQHTCNILIMSKLMYFYSWIVEHLINSGPLQRSTMELLAKTIRKK